MMQFTGSRLNGLALHRVGNKSAEEGIEISRSLLEVSDEIKDLLLQYFLTPFKTEEYYNLAHPSDLEMHEVYRYASAIFDDPSTLLEHSGNLARHLYRHSTHPKIKTGEFYVALLENCFLDDGPVDAIGIFKSESRETYLKVYPAGGSFTVGRDDGINIHKLDKGCLIFNTCREEGYLVAITDNLNKAGEAQYWRDDFIQARPRADNYHQTLAVMDLCKKFVTDRLPEEFEVSRADQADLLNRSMKFLRENDAFESDEFNEQVLGSPAIIDSFSAFRNQQREERDIGFPENFEISDSAVKKQSRFMKSVIKLDKNFHIYVHGERQMVEKGFDEAKQMNFYKLFFREES